MNTPADYSSDGLVATLSIKNEKSVDRNYILREADEMWEKTRGKILNPKDQHEEFVELFTKIRKEHKEFSESYPMVVRCMTQMNSYNHDVFDRYLKRIETKMWKSSDEYLDSQTDYVVMLMKWVASRKDNTSKKHLNMTEKANIRSNIRKLLDVEDKEFKEKAKLSEERITLLEKNISQESKHEVRGYVERVIAEGVITHDIVEFSAD